MIETEPVTLPGNWRHLKNSEKFVGLRDSTRLIRGQAPINVQIDCLRGTIKDLDSNSALQVNFSGRETGSFFLTNPSGDFVMGKLDDLHSNVCPDDRIFVLGRGNTTQNGKPVRRELRAQELIQMANLLENFVNKCASRPRPVKAYVIYADLER
jgi:hypothetical protein